MNINIVSPLILVAIIISSCTTTRVNYTQTAGHSPNEKPGYLKKKDLICITPERQYPESKNKTAFAKKTIFNQSSKLFASTAPKNKGSAIRKTIIKNRNTENDFLITRHGKTKENLIPLNIIIKEPDYSKSIETINLITPHNSSYEVYGTAENFIISEAGVVQSSETKIFPPASYFSLKVKEFNQSAGNQDLQQKIPVQKKGRGFYLMTFISGVLLLFGLKKTPEYAKQVSRWATMNPWKARLMIAGIHIAMGISGIIIGENLAENGTHFTDLSGNLLVGTFLTSALLYPVRKSPSPIFSHTYIRQKTHDLLLFLTGFMLLVNMGNNSSNHLTPGVSATSSGNQRQRNDYVTDIKSIPVTNLLFYQNEKQLQDEKKVPAERGTDIAGKVILTLLAIGAALGLGYLLLLLCCSLACSGLEGLAWLAGIGGGAIIIALLAWTIKIIFNHKPKVVQKEITL